jgi:hypothetical protein
MKSLREFEAYYRDTLRNDLETLDQRRKRILKRTMILIATGGGAILVSILLAILLKAPEKSSNLFLWLWLPLIILTGSIITWSFWAHDRKFHRDFKEGVIRRIVNFISPWLEYEPHNFVGADSFVQSRIFLNRVDRYKGDDMVHGLIDKTQLWFSEIKAEYKTTTTNSKGQTRTQWHTLFKGLFFVADFNKHFQTSTVVLPNRFGRGGLAQLFQRLNLTRREKPIRLEDPEFNRYFVVYGDDQVESRYVLSTSLMQRITDFRKKHNNPLFISFVNSFIYVAIGYNRDLFEPSYFKSLTRFETVKEYFEDIQLAVGIVEDMNLNTRIWTKQ